MGNKTSFSSIQKKYQKDGVDYIVSKYHQRNFYSRINEEVTKLKLNANQLETQDLAFIDTERKNFQYNFNQAVKEAQTKNPKSIQEASSKAKQTVEEFSGYNDEMRKLEKIERDLKQSYQKSRIQMQQKVRKQIQNHQGVTSTVNKIPQYDNAPDNYRRNIENECIKKYPERAQEVYKTQLQQKINWANYKNIFESILDREKLKNQLQGAKQRVKDNIVPGGALICC